MRGGVSLVLYVLVKPYLWFNLFLCDWKLLHKGMGAGAAGLLQVRAKVQHDIVVLFLLGNAFAPVYFYNHWDWKQRGAFMLSEVFIAFPQICYIGLTSDFPEQLFWNISWCMYE